MGGGMGIGIGWPNASASNQVPGVYTYEVNNCGGPQGLIYSSSPVFEAGITIYLNIGLTEPVESNTFGDPFNVGLNEPSPGYKCNDVGFVVESNTTCP